MEAKKQLYEMKLEKMHPEWMECENDCASCSSDTCNHRTEEYQVVDDIYDPDAYLYREVIKK